MEKAVLITTEHRGVFFGYLVSDVTKEKLTLRDARNCVYWDSGMRGFLGLAADGPSRSCKIGPKVPELVLYDITSVTVCTEAAAAKWEDAPWSR